MPTQTRHATLATLLASSLVLAHGAAAQPIIEILPDIEAAGISTMSADGSVVGGTRYRSASDITITAHV